MDNQKFIDLCKSQVQWYLMGVYKVDVDLVDIYVVWSCKTLQNNKALLSTNISDGMYYEITFNGDKNELYLDAYKKQFNQCIKL